MIKNLVIVALITLNLSFGWYIYNLPAAKVDSDSNPNPVTSQMPVVSSTVVKETATSKIQTTEEINPVVPEFESDYASFTDQLRSAGYDEDVVRGVLASIIERDHLIAQQNTPPEPYWLQSDTEPEEELRIELDWLDQKRQQLREIFGDEIEDDPLFADLFNPLNDSLSFLASDKQIQIHELQRISTAKAQALYRQGYIRESRLDHSQVRQLLQDQIRETLTNDEYFEYQLRESRLASSMQRSMKSFDYTEQEFRDLYKIRSQNEGSEFNQIADRAGMREKREISNAQIKDYLTTDRYVEYQRAQDPVYRSLQSIGDRYGNSNEEIVAVYEVTNETKSEMADIRDTEGLNREERRSRLEEVQKLSYEKIEEIAGKDTADSVRNNARRIGINGPRRGRM